MTLMLTHQVAIAADRFYKRPHPGRKRLVKYPRKLEPRPRNEQGWDAGTRPPSCVTDLTSKMRRLYLCNRAALQVYSDVWRYLQTRSTCG